MDHPLRLHRTDLDLRPWRVAVLGLAGIAAVELVLLVVAGGALLARDGHAAAAATRRPGTTSAPTTTAHAKRSSAQRAPSKAATTMLARRRIGVVVLNGNGRQGAAGRIAASAASRGYRIRSVGNAPASSYPQSLVMYRPGFAPEGRRLARDLGIRIVAPLDGMRPSQLHGAHAVLILGG